ncbi:Cro/Cl family transcriptional regulator [Rhizobium sp. Root149]|uniref:helix-turn-helix domain-containing protein n=1 Tax=Rhizobium TaxID=379 RepID=UPI0007155E99|nr:MULTISPECIES: XRE family transcriptional regulator [Rhizobium]KQZ50821.1 Cro/Cl family transcriptional regulator [Rhizobium sp. Root149]
MAERKIFAGPKVRRLRQSLDLTQTAMAEGLGISPSYLNLIERNQRPLTVQLLLRLASVYKVDLEQLQAEGGGAAAQLREVFADPLLAGEIPGDQELVDLAEGAPNAAGGVLKLYRAYREQAVRLSDLAEILAREGHETSISGTRLPIDLVREKLEGRSSFFARIEAAAEAFLASLPSADDPAGQLKAWLKSSHGISVRILPVHAMPMLRRRYDRHSMRLFLSERLSLAERRREVAQEVALLALREEIAQELQDLALPVAEAQRIARFELARLGALALMMPYGTFLAAAQRARFDVEVLAARFDVSFEQAAFRLSMLGRPGSAVPPFFIMEVDHAGNHLRRAGVQGFPKARFGGNCPKLGHHLAFSQPGQILVDCVEMPDATQFLTICRTIDSPHAAYGERLRRTALLLGCELEASGDIIYRQAAEMPAARVLTGTACRLCERQGCLSRAEPPVTRPLGLDEMVTGLSAYDFQ